MEKTCTRCGKTQPLSEFHKDKSKKDGHVYICKRCRRPLTHAYNVASRERRAARSTAWKKAYSERGAVARRRWKKAHPERVRDTNLRVAYGISLADYNETLKEQDNGCAICGKTSVEEGKRLSVDHDHETGQIRGLLCMHCNLGLGWFMHDLELLGNATAYLEQREAG